MNRIIILRVTLILYLLLSVVVPYVIFNPSLPLEALNYMQIGGEANSGIGLSNLLSKAMFVLGHVIALVGIILLFINRTFGKKPFIIGGLIAFIGLVGLLPKYLPSVFTAQAIVVLCVYFYIFGLTTAFAVNRRP